MNSGPLVEVYGKTMCFCIAERLVLLVHNEHVPSDEEWERYIHELAGFKREIDGFLVVAESATLTATQRKRLVDVFGDNQHRRAAIIFRSALVHGVMTAIGWFVRNLKAFRYSELDLAHRYLGTPKEKRADIERRMALYRIDLACGPSARSLSDHDLVKSLEYSLAALERFVQKIE